MKLFIWFKHASSLSFALFDNRIVLVLFSSLCVGEQDFSLSDTILCVRTPYRVQLRCLEKYLLEEGTRNV